MTYNLSGIQVDYTLSNWSINIDPHGSARFT